MSQEILKLEVGEKLQLQRISAEQGERYQVTLIGYLPRQSLLVTAPTIDDKVQLIRDGARFAVRMLEGVHAWGFVSVVLHMATRPYPYLHLSFPEEVESIAIRNAERIEISLPALIRNTRHPDEPVHWHPVMVRDISLSGARLESVKPLGAQGEQLELRFRTEICGNDESLGLFGEIRNSEPRAASEADMGGHHLTGICFRALNRFQQLLLNSFVLEQRFNQE